jgi:hypothetical protein
MSICTQSILAREPAALGGVAVADGGSCVEADVRGLIDREDHRHGRIHAALADLLAVEVQRGGAALARAAAVVPELHP